MIKHIKNIRREILIYISIIAVFQLAMSLSNAIFSNYFKDAYNVTAYQRGLIEFPREIPGLLCVFIIGSLSFIGEIRLIIVAEFFTTIGLVVLGILTPSFVVMLIFIFVNSLGMHVYFPLLDSVGIDLIKDKKNIGKQIGQYRGVSTAFSLFGSMIVFIGFKFNVFSFTSKIKWVFVIAAFLIIVAMALSISLAYIIRKPIHKRRKISIVYRKEYNFFYILTIMFGVQKQIMFVYGPWLLIDILNKKADTLAILSVIGAFLGMFFVPIVGRWTDRFGIRKVLLADGISFVAVFMVYGILSAGFVSNTLIRYGFPVILAYLIIIADKMSNQMGLVRVIYLKSILIKDSDFTPSLSFGVSLDHVVSIAFAYIGGVIWSGLGPQYVFFSTAVLSLINVYVALKVKDKEIEKA